METTMETTRKHFSQLGWMYFLGTLIVFGVQAASVYGLRALAPELAENTTVSFLVAMILGIVKGSMVSNNLLQIVTSNNIWANVIVVGILAPIIEEYVFRKLLIDRTIKYGKELPY